MNQYADVKVIDQKKEIVLWENLFFGALSIDIVQSPRKSFFLFFLTKILMA